MLAVKSRMFLCRVSNLLTQQLIYNYFLIPVFVLLISSFGFAPNISNNTVQRALLYYYHVKYINSCIHFFFFWNNPACVLASTIFLSAVLFCLGFHAPCCIITLYPLYCVSRLQLQSFHSKFKSESFSLR